MDVICTGKVPSQHNPPAGVVSTWRDLVLASLPAVLPSDEFVGSSHSPSAVISADLIFLYLQFLTAVLYNVSENNSLDRNQVFACLYRFSVFPKELKFT